jgi:threonylcarbamoyladenosine tRNA methylthiotransferase MtaB
VQQYPEAFKGVPGVSLLLGSVDRMNPFGALENEVPVAISSINPETISPAAGAPDNRTRAFLKIQDGCSSACTYCIVPQARGPSRSVSPEGILNSVVRLCDCGFQEIVLSGVHIGDYGRGLDGWNLTKLLEHIGDLGSNCRIRLSSLEPWTVTPSLLEIVRSSGWICPHFHIPFQSGSSKVLKLMGRPYQRQDLEKIFDAISELSGVGLGGDVIAGFPGEEDSDFQETIEFIQKYPFTYLHVFPFSRRPGTEAFHFSAQNKSPEITRRAQVLRELGSRKKASFHSALLSTTQKVIFERTRHQGYWRGVSANYAKVRVKDSEIQPGKIHSIRIADISNRLITGELIN